MGETVLSMQRVSKEYKLYASARARLRALLTGRAAHRSKKYAEIETKNTAALAIEMGADAVDIGKTIHPHPTLGESIGMAAEVAHGSCTDVPPARK